MGFNANVCLAASVVLACAGPLHAPKPGHADLFGRVELLPRTGAPPSSETTALYADRRYRDARLVDYSRPGFAVVYTDTSPALARTHVISILDSRFGTELQPSLSAMAVSDELRLRNETAEAHLVSCPADGELVTIEAGGEAVLRFARRGPRELVVLDRASARASVFVAPGPHAVVADSGTYELRDLAPGTHRVSVWHPRFPGQTQQVELVAGERTQVDLKLGVDLIGEDRP